MAKVSVSYDTVDKRLSVSIDGKELDDVTGVNIYKSWVDPDGDDDDEPIYSVNISQATKDEEHDIYTRTTTCASHGIKLTNQSPVSSAIADFFRK